MTTHFRNFPPGLDEIVATTDLQRVSVKRAGIYRRGLKRVFDTALVVLSAPFVLPIVGFLALVIAFDGGRPFYHQERIGRGGKVYRIWKLRTMVCDADARLETFLNSHPDHRAEWSASQKLKADPRITRFGRFLRKSSLDELPQLWNVLKGDMSIVGPRPMMANQEDMYPGLAYYDLRPGITGYWQISDRNDTAFSERAFYDTQYDADLSFAMDLKILGATVGVVLRGTGY